MRLVALLFGLKTPVLGMVVFAGGAHRADQRGRSALLIREARS
jgi:hypothetical protein